MDDAEKLTALKKAYADIILNTAKEAAARIMLSERKAIRFQQELFAAKEEALHMLLRLKQMMDSKVSEAEMTSLSQQRRIEELDAQLQEAEDIVRDLREELREVHAELEKATTKQLQPLDEQNLKGYTATQEETSQENRLNTSGSIVFPPLDSQPEPLTTSDMKNSILNQRNEGNKCYSTKDSHLENRYVGNPDFASIIMRSKEPDLYRNGCTQRIRAFERNLLDGKLSLSGQVDDVKNQSIIREDEEGKGMCITTTPKADNSCSLEKNPDEIKEVMQAESSCYQVLNRKRKRRPRRKRSKLSSNITFIKKKKRSKLSPCRHLPNQVTEICQASDLSFSKTYTYPVNNNVQSSENPSKITENEAQKYPESPAASGLDTTETNTQSGCVEVTESNAEFVKACSVRNTINDDKALIDKLVLTRQESGSPESSGPLVSKMDLETVNVPLVNSELKASDATTDVPSQPANDRLIKYTFRRKRKKESLSSTDGSASLEESILKRKMEEKQNDSPEPQKSSLIIESSRDSRRLAQVARQLISLSEKKWWQ